jgi:hypothetical protein
MSYLEHDNEEVQEEGKVILAIDDSPPRLGGDDFSHKHLMHKERRYQLMERNLVYTAGKCKTIMRWCSIGIIVRLC